MNASQAESATQHNRGIVLKSYRQPSVCLTRFPVQNLEIKKRCTFLAVVVVVFAVVGYQTQQQMIQSQQAMAIQTALNRAQFEMNCPTARGTVLSTNIIQPVFNGPLVQGTYRTEFTIGVRGCGQRRTYIVVCPQGSTGCYATAGR
jgi:hypothetical protein